MTMKNNLEIWSAVDKTDPDHTKHVNQRGGFTAIDAHYQVHQATEQFGPIGIGWGYVADAPIFQGGAIIVPVTLWHTSRDNTFGPVYGCADFDSKRLDTDGLTKALSLLGFNADVFMGKFDDNKYIEKRKAEEKQKKTPVVPTEILEAITGTLDLEGLHTVWTANKDWQSHPDFAAAKDARKTELMKKAA
jgi:hypothetical protein